MLAKNIKVVLFEFQNAIFRTLIKSEFVRQGNRDLIFVGNDYSGYWFPEDLIELKGTIWGIGLGHDSSFELELLSKGYKVLGFEPEAECFKSSKNQFKGLDAELFNYGLWDKSGLFEYTGENISLVNIFDKGDFREKKLEIRSLWEVAKKFDLSQNSPPKVLRMNIEGAEQEILQRLCKEPLDFDAIVFQSEFIFHLPFKAFRKRFVAYGELRRILKSYRKNNWVIVALIRNQFIMTKDDFINV